MLHVALPTGVLTALALALALLIAWPQPAPTRASTIIEVDTIDDNGAKSGCLPLVADDCSLRGAFSIASDGDTIGFNIPGAGPHTIHLGSALQSLTVANLTIDGYTQPGASENTAGPWQPGNAVIMIELDGSNAGQSAIGLTIRGAGWVVRGLAINGFAGGGIVLDDLGAGSAVIEGNHIGTDVTGQTAEGNLGIGGIAITSVQPGTVIGGPDPEDRNVISGNSGDGVFISGDAPAVMLQGNFIGSDADGADPLPNTRYGIGVFSNAQHQIGGSGPGEGNLLSGNSSAGLRIDTTGQVLGNRIGPNAAGTAPLLESAVGSTGILVLGASNVLIGGAAPGAGNVVSGNPQAGIWLTNGAQLVQIRGNLVGTAPDGVTPLPNGNVGIYLVDGAHDNTIGGENPAAQNTIAYNSPGILLQSDAGVDNYIDPNIMHSNDGLGIDISPAGVVNPNDQDDADSGPNDLQNYPVLTAAFVSNSITIEGTLNTEDNKSLNLFFFSNSVCDPLGYGEGETFLGDYSTSTSIGEHDIDFSVTFNVDVTPGHFITATASSPESTSEFSQCIEVTGMPSSPTPTPTPTPTGQTPTPTPTGPTPTGQSPTPTPTPTATPQPAALTQGDNDCDGDSDAVDALQGLRHVAGLAVNQQPECIDIGAAVPAGAEPQLFGDIDCDGDVDAVDALQILRQVAGLPVNQEEGCPAIGEPL